MRDLVARGKRSAPATAARRESSAERCRGLVRAGSGGWVPRGVVPPPSAGASFARSSQTRYHALRFVYAPDVGYVARRKRQRTRESSAERCRGLVRAGSGGWVPRGVVPPPSAGASFARSSQTRYHALRFVYAPDVGYVARRKRQRTRESSAKQCRG